MKKLLLFVAAMVMSFGAMAEEVSFTFKTDNDITYTATGTSGGGAACTVSKSNVILNGTDAYTAATKSLSVYANSTLTITAPGNITQIDLEYNGKVYPFDEAVGDGTVNTKFATSGAHPATYTPSTPATSVTLNNTNGGKTELLSLKVTYTGGTVVNVTGVSLNQTAATLTVGDKLTLTATVAPANATNNSVAWSSSDTEKATVANGVVSAKGTGEVTITATTADGSFTATCNITISAKQAPEGAIFFESFDGFDGDGGNDDVWTGITTTKALGTFDNEGWTIEGSVLSGSQCASIRKGTEVVEGVSKSIPSGLTTPALGAAGNGTMTFKAEAWGGDTNDFYIDIVGGGTFAEGDDIVTLTNNATTAKIRLNKSGEWKTYTLCFEGLTEDSKFRFYMAAGKRGFLDEVAIWVEAPAVDYYMIGSEELFGEEGMIMTTSDDETYTLTLENKALAAGDYTYGVETRPVVEEESANAPLRVAPLPAAKSFTLAQDGTYNIRFDYNAETGVLTTTDLSNGFATGLENTALKAEKIFRNGQIVILKNGAEYNAVGQKL